MTSVCRTPAIGAVIRATCQTRLPCAARPHRSHAHAHAVRSARWELRATSRAAGAVILLLLAPPVLAQVDPSKDAKVHLGPLALSPALGLTNAGIDTNVFNEPDEAAPKRDLTMTVEPKTDFWLPMGPTWIIGTASEDLIYFQKYASERSANGSYKAGWLVPLTRLTLKAGAMYLAARERPGYEIDARVDRHEFGYEGSAELRMLSKTFVGIKGQRQTVAFDKTAVFLSTNLHDELNRVETLEAVTARHQLTSLTSLTLDVARRQDRFEIDRLRDADSTLVMGGIAFDPLALLKGSATVGYLAFEPKSPVVPSYKGSTAQVDLSYLPLESTKMSLKVARDVQFSFEAANTYYVQTAVTASIAQRLYGPIDVVGRVGVARLDYRPSVGLSLAIEARSDSATSFGGGFGYHLGSDIRVGVNVDDLQRSSDVPSRRYHGLRYGVSTTYGF